MFSDPTPHPKSGPIWPKKAQNDPKKAKKKVKSRKTKKSYNMKVINLIE